MIDSEAVKGGAAGAAATAATEATVGLERAAAAAAAGDVLQGIFNGLPWEMDPFEIVEAVGGEGGAEAAAVVVDVVGTLL